MKDTIELYFESRSEHRDWYLERYEPPSPGAFFAILILTVLDESLPDKIAQEMEIRAKTWYEAHPIPVVVMASRQNDKPTGIRSLKGNEMLSVFPVSKGGSLNYYWESLPDDRFPQKDYSNGELLSIYPNFGMRTGKDLRRKNALEQRSLRTFLWLSRFGLIVVPAIWLVYQELFSPNWFPVAIMIFGLLKYGRELCISVGLMKRTTREKEKSAKEEQERHYIYHCEQNPEGFERLKRENGKRYLESRKIEREKSLLAKKNADQA